MDEEWRVSLVIRDPAADKKVSARAGRALLRNRVGKDVYVTAGTTGTLLYAASADAAEAAERTAHEVLAERGLVGDIRVERWDLSRKAWVDVRTELPSGHEGRRRFRGVGKLIGSIIEGIGAAGV